MSVDDPLALTGVPGMDHDLFTHDVVLRFRHWDGEEHTHPAEWRIPPKDLLEVLSALTAVAARTLGDVGKAIAVGHCDTCSNRRVIEMDVRDRRTTVDCPECRPRYDKAVAFEHYPRVTWPEDQP